MVRRVSSLAWNDLAVPGRSLRFLSAEGPGTPHGVGAQTEPLERVGRATCEPHQADKSRVQRTVTVTVSPPMTWLSRALAARTHHPNTPDRDEVPGALRFMAG
jgi:hypothetical protein